MAKQLFFGERIGPHRIKTPEGYLIACRIPATRTGWQQYRASELQIDNLAPDTIVNVYRDAADVFDPVSMASFEGKSITRTHPREFLNAENDREHSCGHVQNVQRGERLPDGNEAMYLDLFFKDSQLIQYVNDDVMAELSGGYTYNLVPYKGPGWDDGELRLQMKDIRGNHIAVVQKARGGEHLRVLDAGLEEGDSKMEWKDFVAGLKDAGLRLVTARDAESETVKTQEEKDKEALELKQRTMDAEAEAEEKKEKEEKKAQDKAILNALVGLQKTMKDGFEELAKKSEEPKESKAAEDAKCTCDAEEGDPHKEACPMFKKAEDADLIPVATLSKEDRPKNPIPGADAAIANLRALKPVIAASGDKRAIDGFNAAMKSLKGGGSTEDAYKLINDAKGADNPRAGMDADPLVASKKIGAEFEETCKKLHRQVVTVN